MAAGYRRILYFSPFRTAWADARAEGVAAAAHLAGIPVQVEPSVAAPLDWQHLRQDSLEQAQRLRRALRRGLAALPAGDEEDTAIIACNDRVALALRAVQSGLRCGLAGFDDDPSGAHHDLTTARPPAEELAKRAAELAARLWRGEPIPTLTELPWDLVIRGSTRRGHTSAAILSPAATQRIDNSTIAESFIVACPPVVVLTWGEITGLDANTLAHSLRLKQSVDSLMAALQHERVEMAVLPIDFTGEPGAIDRRMQRAVRRVIGGGAKAVIIQELILPAEAEAALAAEQAAGRLHIVRSLTASTANDQPTVLFDQVAAGALAATHCLRQRYKRLLYLSPFSAPWAAERGLSVRRALLLASAGLTPLLMTPEVPEFDHGGFLKLDAAARQRLVAEAFDAGCERLAKLQGASVPPAVIAANDDIALLLLDELEARGLRSGIDVGVVGFDDLPESAARGLTSLAPPMTAMGNELARVITRLFAGGTVPRRTCLPWTISPRQSSMLEHPPG